MANALPDLKIVRTADENRGQAVLRGIDRQDGQVFVRVGTHKAGLPARMVRQRHRRGVRSLNYVVVRDDVPLFIPNEP